MSNKILCIQWCRAIAIISVLAFHLWPKNFPNGFLGVDMFFVISGYLITLIINKLLHERSFKNTIEIFYARRFKRILPNYYITMFYIIGFGTTIFYSVDLQYLQNDAKWATIFANNLKPIIEKDDYFRMTTDYKPFLHLWSLAVELQFYLLAPFMIFLALKSNYFELFMFVFATLSFLTYLYYSTSTVAFNLMFCRLWQFAVGVLIFHRYDKQKKDQFGNYKKYLMILLTIFLFLPYEANAHIGRVLITITSSQLLIMKQIPFDEFVNRFLCYIGDASYSIYLIHWPIIVFYEYVGFTWDVSAIIPIIVISSLFQHHIFELPMQRFSYIINLIVSACFGIAVIILAFMPLSKIEQKFTGYPNITSLEESIKYNEILHSECMNRIADCKRDNFLDIHFSHVTDNDYAKKCVFNFPSNDNKIAVLAGNSYIIAYAKAVIQAIKESRHGRKFKKIYILSQNGCPIFDSLNEDYIEKLFHCSLSHGIFEKILNRLKPNLLVTVNQMDSMKNAKYPLPKDIKTDNISQLLADELKRFATVTKNVVSLEPNFIFNEIQNIDGTVLSVIHKLRNGQSLDDLNIRRQEVDFKSRTSWNRMKWAVKICENCHVVELRDLYCNKTICDYYDKKNNLAYFCDTWHLNDHGAGKIIPRLTEFFNHLVI